MVATSRQLKAQQTRAMMVSAAAAEFARRGYDATSLSDITATFNKPKEALRYHFSSKAQLAQAVLETQYYSWSSMLAVARESSATGIVGLLALLGTAADESTRSPFPRAAIALLTNRSTLEIELPEVPFDWFEVADSYLIAATTAREIAIEQLPVDTSGSPSTRATADVLINSSFGVHQAHHHGLESVDILELLARVWRPLLVGFGAHDADAMIGDSQREILSRRASLK